MKFIKVIGIDPGSVSWDLFGIKTCEDTKEYKIFLDYSIKTDEIRRNPRILIDKIEEFEPFDYLASPSGFGFPIKNIRDLSENDIFEMVLRTNSEPTMGLKTIVEEIKKKKNWNAFVLPGIKHLPTVQDFRKINKLDMGTADKLCSVVVGIKDICERNNIPCNQTNFIMIELGGAFSSIVAVENGRIIDGIGGSNLLGFKACGNLDGELVPLIKNFSKKTIYKGGFLTISQQYGKQQDKSLEEILIQIRSNYQTKKAMDALIDAIVKGVHAIKTSFTPKNPPNYILLSGRLVKEPFFRDILERKLFTVAPVRIMKNYGKIAKRAAQGAAFIAEGLNGGPSGDIVKNMMLKSAKGSIFDEIYFPLDISKKY